MRGRAGAPDPGDAARLLGHGTRLSLAGSIAAAVSSLGLVLLTVRALPASDAGRVFVVTSALLVAGGVLRIGTPTGVVLFVARLDARSAGEVRRVAGLALRPVWALSTLVAVAALPLAGWLGRRCGIHDHPVATVAVVLCSLPAVAVLDTVLAVSRARQQMATTVVVDRLGRPLAQVVLTAVALLHPSVLTVVAAWCLPYLLAVAAAYVLTPELRAPRLPRDLAVERSERRALARFVLPRGATSIIQVLFARLDILLVAALAGPAEAAVYTVATRFVALCQVVQQAVATASEPALARALAEHGELTPQRLYRTTTTWLVVLVWPVLLAVVALAPEWLAIFGRTYTHAWDVVTVLALAMLVAMAVGMVETVLNMDGRSGLPLASSALGLMVMVGLDLALIPSLGALGAAVGWGTSIVVKNLVSLVLMVRTTDAHPLARAWLVAVGVNVATLGVLPWVGLAVAGPAGRVAGTMVAGCVLLAAYSRLRDPLQLDLLLRRNGRPTSRLPVAAR